MNRISTLLAIIIFTTACGSCRNARTQSPGQGVELEPVFPALRFTRPLALESPRDGTDRLFVVEQPGRISVFPNDPDVAGAKTFLDIRSLVNSAGNEEGLLGLAFHPAYKSNGYFYLNYTASNPRRTVIARYRVSAADPDAGDPLSALILLEFDQPFSNHNGGQLAFGPDGYLYIATGDGGSGGDPYGNGQSLKTLLGKILRIDIDHPGVGTKYGIPPDNPFVGTAFRGEIWAYGLRNPWRFSFDPDNGRLWAGDVGQDKIEEVDIIEKGRNYGWNRMEGSACFQPSHDCDTTGLVLPVWEYTHADGVCVTGGYVYRGSRRPELRGAYICADYGNGKIWALRPGTGGKAKATELTESRLPIASFGVDNAHELYICSFDGRIYAFKR